MLSDLLIRSVSPATYGNETYITCCIGIALLLIELFVETELLECVIVDAKRLVGMGGGLADGRLEGVWLADGRLGGGWLADDRLGGGWLADGRLGGGWLAEGRLGGVGFD